MCVDKYVCFSCGHLNPPVHVPCPLIRANEHYITRCSISARHFVQEDKYCNACHRADWQQKVLAAEEVHRQKHISQGGICIPDCGNRFFTDKEGDRMAKGKLPDQDFVAPQKHSSPPSSLPSSLPSHLPQGYTHQTFSQPSTPQQQRVGYPLSTPDQQTSGYASVQTPTPVHQNNLYSSVLPPVSQQQAFPTAQTSAPRQQNNSHPLSHHLSHQQQNYGHTFNSTSTPQHQNFDLQALAPPHYSAGWPYNQATLPQQQNYPIYHFNARHAVTTRLHPASAPQQYMAPPPIPMFNGQLPHIYPPTHLGPPLTREQKDQNKDNSKHFSSSGSEHAAATHFHGPSQQAPPAEWDIQIDHRYSIGHSDMPGPVTGLPMPLELKEIRARDEHMAGISTHPYAVSQESSDYQHRRPRPTSNSISTEMHNSLAGATEVEETEVQASELVRETPREYVGYQTGSGPVTYNDGRDEDELDSDSTSPKSAVTVLNTGRRGREQTRSVFPRVHMWDGSELDADRRSESAGFPLRSQSH